MPDLVTVGIGDCKVTGSPDAVLATYALGSCIALTIYDPVANIGGLLHFMLPESSLNPARASQNPCVFADVGIPTLFNAAYELGASRNRLLVRAAGGAQVMGDNGVFNIGKRNHLALRRILWKAGVMLHAEDIGGTVSRTVRMELATGRVWIQSAGEARELISAGRGRKG